MTAVGQPITLTFAFTDSAGAFVDPDDVTAYVTKPNGTLDDFEASKEAVGRYFLDYIPDVVGRYQAYAVGSGGVASTSPTDVFHVEPTESFAIISLVEARLALNIPASSTKDDDDLRFYIDAATPVIEDLCGPVVARNVTLTFDGGRVGIPLGAAVRSVLSVSVGGVALPSSSFTFGRGSVLRYGAGQFIGSGGDAVSARWPAGLNTVVVTARVGFDSIPPNLRGAAREQVRFLWQNGKQSKRGGSDADSTETPSGFLTHRRVVELCAGNLRAPTVA